MRKEIVRKIAMGASNERFDAVICCSPESFAYVAGFVVPSQPLIRHRHAMVTVTADGRTAVLGVDMEASTIRRHLPDSETRIWAEFGDDPMLVLTDQLSSLGLAKGRIAIEMDYLPGGDLRRLERAMPSARYEDAAPLLGRLRQIKTKDEIALLRRLSRISDQAITDALAAVKEGDSEMDIAGHLTRNVYALGAQNFKLLIVATGERSMLPNVGPSDRRLRPGDVCRVEIFSVINGYQAGVCRTAVVGEAPPMAERIWAHLVECKYEILEKVRPGASCRQIYSDFIAKLSQMNLPPISFVGHGIGLHLHEEPYLGQVPDDVVLEQNMVLGFEPLCYNTGYGFGMQNKDMLLVTANGSELLSDYCNTDRLIQVGLEPALV